MNTVHVRSSSGMYGAENVLMGLLPELSRLGVPQRLLCFENHVSGDRSLADRAAAAGIDAAVLPCRSRFDLRTLRAMRAVFDQALARDPHTVIHCHDYKSLLHGLLAARGRPLPIVSTSHGHFAGSAALRLYNRLEVLMMRRVDRVMIVAESMRRRLVADGVSPARIVLTDNGIDIRRFHPDTPPLDRATFGLGSDDFVFVTAIRLSAEKNPLGLLEAFAAVHSAHPHARLLIAGDGALRTAIIERAQALGITASIQLLGARDDLPQLYPMSDCFVLPSLTEGLPLALLEAMACALPVIASDVGHVGRVLAGVSAALLPPGDIAALSAAMADAIARPRGRSAALRTRVCKRYSAAQMARQHRDVYTALQPSGVAMAASR